MEKENKSTDIKMTYTDIVKKLIGEVEPIGDSRVDEERMENLKVLCELTNHFVEIIDNVHYSNKDRHEHSIKIMSDYAGTFLTKILNIKE